MLADGLQLINRSGMKRVSSAFGTTFPVSPAPVDLQIFELIDTGATDGVYMYSEGLGEWVLIENVISDAYDIGLTIFDRPKADDIVAKHLAARTFVIKPNFVGSLAKANVAATATSVFPIFRVLADGVTVTQIGTITFGAGQVNGVIATSGSSAFVIKRGQTLRVKSPIVRDATLSNIDITLCAELFVPR